MDLLFFSNGFTVFVLGSFLYLECISDWIETASNLSQNGQPIIGTQ